MGKRQSVLEYFKEKEAKAKGKVYVKKKKRRKKKKDPLRIESQETSLENGPEEEPPVDIGRLDLRVGKMVWAQNHPLVPESHYLQYIHLNSSTLTMVVSELKEHFKEDELANERDTVVLRNIRPPNVYGEMSYGLVLCAVKDGKPEHLSAPEGSLANDKIYVPGYPRRPDKPYMKPHKMIYETVVQDLRVNDQKQVVYRGVPLQVKGREGFITSQTLTDCPVKCV